MSGPRTCPEKLAAICSDSSLEFLSIRKVHVTGTVPGHGPGRASAGGARPFGRSRCCSRRPGCRRSSCRRSWRRLYGGSLGFEEPRVFANFVSTIDGVVAIPSLPSSNKLVAGGSAADRFVLGLLRACADVLVIGSGTMAASPRSIWTAEQAYPRPRPRVRRAAAAARARRRSPRSRSSPAAARIDPDAPRVRGRARSCSPPTPAPRGSRDALPRRRDRHARAGPSTRRRAVAALHARGHRLILSEGGPHAIAPVPRRPASSTSSSSRSRRSSPDASTATTGSRSSRAPT